MRTRLLHRTVQLRRQRAIQNIVHQRGLARARNAGDHRQKPQRNRHVDILQIVSVRPRIVSAFHWGCGAPRAPEFSPPRKVFPGQRRRIRRDFFRRPRRDKIPARLPAPGPDPPRSRRAESFPRRARRPARYYPDPAKSQRTQQPLVVARVQPDRGLVQHVKHAAQPRSDLRRQPNPLRLAPESVAAERSSVR